MKISLGHIGIVEKVQETSSDTDITRYGSTLYIGIA